MVRIQGTFEMVQMRSDGSGSISRFFVGFCTCKTANLLIENSNPLAGCLFLLFCCSVSLAETSNIKLKQQNHTNFIENRQFQ